MPTYSVAVTTTVGDPAVPAIPSAVGRKRLRLYNNGSNVIYLSDNPSLTTGSGAAAGFPLQPGTYMEEHAAMTAPVIAAWYAITAADTSELRVWETY